MTTTSNSFPVVDRAGAAILAPFSDRPLVTRERIAGIRSQIASAATDALGAGPNELRLDAYYLRDLLDCPAKADASRGVPFQWSTLFAARGIALRALNEALSARKQLAAAVAEQIEWEITDGRSLGSWLATLGRPARAATETAALAWATKAWLAAPWRTFERVSFTAASTQFRPVERSNVLTLIGRPDAVIRVATPHGPGRALVRVGRYELTAVQLDVLVSSLERLNAPLRHVSLDTASGSIVAVDVDEQLLDEAASRVLDALATSVENRDERVAGAQCAWCDLRGTCDAGVSWLEDHRLVGRLPVVASDDLPVSA